MSYFKIMICVLLPIALIIGLTACAVNPVTGRGDFVMMSEDKEIALGRQLQGQISAQYGGLYDNPNLQAYVQRVGESLAANSHRSHLIYRFTVLDSPMVNAFALPGGYIYITRGLLAYLNSEAELAAVLGHEIGHVTARHSVRQISATRAADMGYKLGSLFLPELRTQAAQSLFNVLGSALISGYGRDHELESDRLGAEYLARTGYDPQAMIAVIGVLKNQEQFEQQLAKEEGREPSIYHGVFASHPRNDKRLQEVVASVDRHQAEIKRDSHRQEFLQNLKGLVFGDSERHGIVRNNTFYHYDLGIAVRLPNNWKIDNRSDRLIAQAPKGEALLQMTMEEFNKSISPQAFIKKRLNFDKITKGKKITGTGLEGYTGVVTLGNKASQQQARVAVIYFNHQAYVFIGATKGKLIDFDSDFLQVAESLHELSVAERKLATALTVIIRKKKMTDSFAELAKHSPLAHHAEDQLRLLNGYYPTGEMKPGDWLKLIQ